MFEKPDNHLCDKIIGAVKEDKKFRQTRKIRLVVVLACILLIALLVLVFSMGMLVGEQRAGRRFLHHYYFMGRIDGTRNTINF